MLLLLLLHLLSKITDQNILNSTSPFVALSREREGSCLLRVLQQDGYRNPCVFPASI